MVKTAADADDTVEKNDLLSILILDSEDGVAELNEDAILQLLSWGAKAAAKFCKVSKAVMRRKARVLETIV